MRLGHISVRSQGSKKKIDLWQPRRAIILFHHLGCLQVQDMVISVKDTRAKATSPLTGKGHAEEEPDDQALAGAMKPNLVRALIQRGALR
jgi:hypothetical protein